MTPTKKITVHVTKETIDAAPGYSCNDCPIHQALLPFMKSSVSFQVGRCEVRFCRSYDLCYLPDVAQKFAGQVWNDKGAKNVEPISFDLDVPLWALSETPVKISA